MEIYDERLLTDRVRAFDRAAKTAFAASCAQRLVPFFQRYSVATGLPEQYDRLSEIVDTTWASVEDPELLHPGMEGEAEALVPDSDGNWILEMGYADNAAAAAAFAVGTSVRNGVQEAVWAARQLYDVTDYAVQMRYPDLDFSTTSDERFVLELTLVQRAIGSINVLLEHVASGHYSVQGLRSLAVEEGNAWVVDIP